jgi:hypothetical protein
MFSKFQVSEETLTHTAEECMGIGVHVRYESNAFGISIRVEWCRDYGNASDQSMENESSRWCA